MNFHTFFSRGQQIKFYGKSRNMGLDRFLKFKKLLNFNVLLF